MGIDVHPGHAPDHVSDADALVITAAVPDDHPELQAARARGIPVVKRAAALGAWVRRGKVVAIAGTHGKTTTTAMTAEVLSAAGQDPSAFVGGNGRSRHWASNYLPGADRLFVVEADEFDRSFLTLDPDVAVVTNVEADHLDIYGDREGVDEAFLSFLGLGAVGRGRFAVCADDPGASRLAPSISARTVTYGLNAGSHLRAVDLEPGPDGTRFKVWERGRTAAALSISVPGTHNVRNALAAALVARALEVGWQEIQRGLAAYDGVGRRFPDARRRGRRARGGRLCTPSHGGPSDAGGGAPAYPKKRLVAVFQPHLYTRTRDFHQEFGAALAAADLVWLTDIYPAAKRRSTVSRPDS